MNGEDEIFEYLKKTRRALHTFPEFSECEFKTSEFIAGELSAMSLTYKKIHTGLYVDFEGEDNSRRIALRCDMDGLPISEKTGREFAAKENMHACGHDGHMAIMLAMCKLLSRRRPTAAVRVIFQFGEEGEGGADKMIKQGVLDGVDEIYAFHLCPELNKGKMASTLRPMFAGAVEYNVEIEGRASHCAAREKGINALKAATVFMTASELFEQKYPGTLSHIGKIESGTARNIVASRATLYCTYRYFTPEQKDGMLQEARKALETIDRKYGTKSILDIRSVYPPLKNSAKALARMKSAGDIEECEPRYTAEDFAFYTEKTDGCLVWLGTGQEGMTSPLHSETFDFAEDALLTGVETLEKLIF